MAARGRPAGSETKPWKDAVRKAASAIDPSTKRRNLELLAESLIRKAKDGDIGAIKEFGDRYDGKVPQALQHQGHDGSALVVKWEQ